MQSSQPLSSPLSPQKKVVLSGAPIRGLFLVFGIAYTALNVASIVHHDTNALTTLHQKIDFVDRAAATKGKRHLRFLLQDQQGEESEDATNSIVQTKTEDNVQGNDEEPHQEQREEEVKDATRSTLQSERAASSEDNVKADKDEPEEPHQAQQGEAKKELRQEQQGEQSKLADATSSTSQTDQATTSEDKDKANDESESDPYRNKLVRKWKAFKRETKEHLPELIRKSDETEHTIGVDTLPHQSLPDFIQGTYNNNTNDVILATHMSMEDNRMDRLDILQRYWQGPISLSVRIRSFEEVNSFFDYYNKLPTDITTTWTVHFLLEYAEPFNPDSFASQYCHNQLRNLALHSPSIPEFVLAVDLDFIPTYEGYPKLMSIMEKQPSLWDKLKQRKLLVFPVMEIMHIPEIVASNSAGMVHFAHSLDTLGLNTSTLMTAWESRSVLEGKKKRKDKQTNKSVQKKLLSIRQVDAFNEGTASDLPNSREDLDVMFRFNLARQWHARKGHAPTNLTQYWSYQPGVTTDVTYPIKPTERYEPFFLGYKPQLPRYWEGFRGYGLNKQSFARECLLSGLQMQAIYELYLTHLAHPSHKDKIVREANQIEWDHRFQPYLEKKYKMKPLWLEGESSKWFGVAAVQNATWIKGSPESDKESETEKA